MRKPWRICTAACICFVALSVPCKTTATGAEADRRSVIVEAISKTRAAIVNLKTLRVIPARFENAEAGRVRGLGTGVCIDPRGYIVTNYHVVEDVNEIEARTSDGGRYPARTLVVDKRADLAVLKIDVPTPAFYLSLQGAGNAILGETVIAIGNPYGLEDSVTIGIVSAIDRELPLPNGEVFKGLIQTDASINPGNSGGPLITVSGELLGINVAIRSNAQGIAFAIPTATVRDIIAGMMPSFRTVAEQGFDVEESPIIKVGGVAEAIESPPLRIARVDEGSTAATAGLQLGDELLSIAGQAIRLRFDFDRVFWDRKPGEVLELIVRRQGQDETIQLSVAGKPLDEDVVWEHLGLRARPVVDPVRRVQPKWRGGLFIMQVREGSPAAVAGFRPGDILTGLHGREVLDNASIRPIMQMDDFSSSQPVSYYLIRDGRADSGRIRVPLYRRPIN